MREPLRVTATPVISSPVVSMVPVIVKSLDVTRRRHRGVAPGLFGRPRLGRPIRRISWWTRSQRIRTSAELRFEVALLNATERPLYQRISAQVKLLDELGLSASRIAAQLGVTDKTVAKGIRWLRRTMRSGADS